MLNLARNNVEKLETIDSPDTPISARRVWRRLCRHGDFDPAPFGRRIRWFRSRFSRVISDDGYVLTCVGDRSTRGRKRVSIDAVRTRLGRGLADLIHSVGEKHERGQRAILAVPRSLVPVLDDYFGGPVARGLVEVFGALDVELVVMVVGPKGNEPEELAWDAIGG